MKASIDSDDKSSIDTATMEKLQKEDEERNRSKPPVIKTQRSESIQKMDRRDSELSILSAPAACQVHVQPQTPTMTVDFLQSVGNKETKPIKITVNRKVGVWLRDRFRDSPDRSSVTSSRPGTAMSQWSEGPPVRVNESPITVTSDPNSPLPPPDMETAQRRVVSSKNPFSRLFQRLIRLRIRDHSKVQRQRSKRKTKSSEPQPSTSRAQAQSEIQAEEVTPEDAIEHQDDKKEKKKKKGALSRISRFLGIGEHRSRFEPERSSEVEAEDERECASVV